MVSTDLIGNVNAIDKVIHRQGAYSPGSAEGITRPWYMHPFQEDNLLVVHGSRDIVGSQVKSTNSGHVK